MITRKSWTEEKRGGLTITKRYYSAFYLFGSIFLSENLDGVSYYDYNVLTGAYELRIQ